MQMIRILCSKFKVQSVIRNEINRNSLITKLIDSRDENLRALKLKREIKSGFEVFPRRVASRIKIRARWSFRVQGEIYRDIPDDSGCLLHPFYLPAGETLKEAA